MAEISDNDIKYIKKELEDLARGGIKITNWIGMVLNVLPKEYSAKPAKNF